MLGRLLSSFQTSLDEITLIALPQQQAPAAKAVQIHSYVDPAKGVHGHPVDHKIRPARMVSC